MGNPALDQQIQSLVTALSQTASVDNDTRTLLMKLQHEVARVAGHHEDASVTERLEEMAIRFEADHPTVGASLRQAIDTLSKAGV